MTARHDPQLERRPRRPGREGHAVHVLPDEAIACPGGIPHETAVRTLALANDETRRATQFLGDPVRDLRQVVELEAEVVRAGSGLGAPVLDDLEMIGLIGGPGGNDRVPGAGDHGLDDGRPDLMERAMLAGWRHDGPPAPRRARRAEGDLSDLLVEFTRRLFGADDVEGIVLEHAESDPVTGREAAVLAIAAVVDLLGVPGEAIPVEGSVHDRRDPPARDGVLAQFEQAGGHGQRVPTGASGRVAGAAGGASTLADQAISAPR